MQLTNMLCLLVAGTTLAAASPALATPRIGAAIVHENLAIYPIHGPSASGPVPLTLQEGLGSGVVEVEETGNVRQLRIENKGDVPVFVQFGDLVKGGRQDRVLTMSLLVPPRSGKVAIGAYCVEQGRWAQRGGEDAKRFSSSVNQLTSRKAKVAIATPAPEAPTDAVANVPQRRATEPFQLRQPQQRREQRVQTGDRGGGRSPSHQSEVWRSVGETQGKLREVLAAPVASEASRTSLQLTLESTRLKEALAAYVAALEAKLLTGEDIVGAVVVVNGRIASADVYPSNGLFRKMWPKLLTAAATEAVASRTETAAARPTIDAIETFLTDTEAGKSSERALPGIARHETRQAAKSLRVEARSADGTWVHRNYLAH